MCPERVMKKGAGHLLSPEQGSSEHRVLSHFADVSSLLMSHMKMAAGERGKCDVNGFQIPLEKKKKDFKNRPGQERGKQHALGSDL